MNSPELRTTDAKLDPAFKAKWIEALRSGAYEQTTGRLRSPDNGFCCLGVACDLIDHSRWTEQPSFNYGDQGYDWGERLTGYVDEALDKVIGIPRGTAKHLSEMNDNRGAGFADIANWIEANL